MESSKVTKFPFAALATRWLAGLFLTGLLTPASAQEKVWISKTTGNWSVPSNWLNNGAPPAGGGDTLALRFPNPAHDTYSIDDYAGQFVVNSMASDQANPGQFYLSADGLRTLRVAGVNSAISHSGAGSTTYFARIIFDPADGVTSISATGGGNLSFNGGIAGLANNQTLRISGSPSSLETQIISMSLPVSPVPGAGLYGNVVLESGNLSFVGESFGAAKIRINGGTLRFRFGPGTLSNTIELASDLVMLNAAASTFSGVISSVTPGAGLQVKTFSSATSPASTLRLTAACTYTGATLVDFGPTSQTPYANAGTLRVSGAGSLLNTSGFDIRSGGTLAVETSTNGITDRLGDNTPIVLRGGRLLLEAPSASATAQGEVVGPISVAGFSSVTVGPASRTLDLTAASLTRLQRGTVLFRSPTLATAGATPARILFANAPTLLGAGGTGPQVSIIPYAIGDTSMTGGGSGLVTYSPSGGVRLLDPASEYATSLSGAGPGDNVRLSSPATMAGNVAINALVLGDAAANLGGTGVLTISSGMLVSNPSSAVASIAVPIDFGAAEGQVFAVKDLTVSQPITGSGGLTKSGAGTLTLAASNSFSGPLTVNAGLIAFSAANQLGSDSSAIVFNGGGLRYTGAGSLVVARPLELGSGFAALDVDLPSAMLVIDAPISGAGALRTGVGGSGTVRLLRANSYVGPTVVSGGVLEFSNDAALGSGDVWIGPGTLRPLAPWNTSRAIHLQGGTLDTGSFDSVWSGPVLGDGSLVKQGAASLTLRNADQFIGGLTVTAGALVIEGGLSQSLAGSGGDRVIARNSHLTGNGSWLRKLVIESGTLSPGPGIGLLSVQDVTLDANSTLNLEILSAAAFDQLIVNGQLSLNGAVNLTLTLGYDPVDHLDSFLMISNDGTDAIAGTLSFSGSQLTENDVFFIGQQALRITYSGGDGNDVAFLAVPEPSALSGLFVALPFLARRRTARTAR